MFATPIEMKAPADFVDVGKEIAEVKIDMRYFTKNNFTGRSVDGYNAPVCLLTKSAAESLKKVVDVLYPLGMTLKIYDCYRPQRAVDDFFSWSQDLADNATRPIFYPNVKKADLFKQGYIASKSSHSRGSTVDLTIVPIDEHYTQSKLDFGTEFDYFDLKSSVSYKNIPLQSKANRLLLSTLMNAAGFKVYEKEWWHFTLINEPYPDTYFGFPVDELEKL